MLDERCFRAESLADILDDFEERAKLIHARWVFKPKGDKDLIVHRNSSESNLARSVLKGKMPQLSEGQVKELLECLDGVLEDVSVPAASCNCLAKTNLPPAISIGKSIRLVPTYT